MCNGLYLVNQKVLEVVIWYVYWLQGVDVTFNLGSARMFSGTFETCFSCPKDIWIATADYCIHQMHPVDTLV